MRAPRRSTLARMPVVAAVLLLSACGGGGGDTSETTSVPATTTATPPKGNASHRGSEYRAPALRPDVEVGSLHMTDRGVKQFRELGNYSTLRYGEEATRSELERAAKVMHGYLVAHMRYDWASSCSYLNEREVEEVDTLAAHFKQVAGKPCPVAISYLLGTVSPAKTFSDSDVQAGVFRVDRDRGYLFYRVDGTPYMMPMSLEEGEWKLYSLFTTPVSRPPSPSSS